MVLRLPALGALLQALGLWELRTFNDGANCCLLVGLHGLGVEMLLRTSLLNLSFLFILMIKSNKHKKFK